MHLFGEVEQLEFTALILGGGEGADQLADAGAIDVKDDETAAVKGFK